MATVTFKPDEGAPATTEQFNRSFGPEPVVVTDEKLLAKLRKMRNYAVIDETAAPDEEQPADVGLKAEHHGGGKFRITQGEDILLKGLSKADADAFNALSDEDKAAYVEAHKVAE